jgi:hypothetical protein
MAYGELVTVIEGDMKVEIEGYTRVVSRCSAKTKAIVADAIQLARGRKYDYVSSLSASSHPASFEFNNPFYLWLGFGDVPFPRAKGESPCPAGRGAVQKIEGIKGWNSFIKAMSEPNGRIPCVALPVTVDCGNPMGSPFNKLPTREEFPFLMRAAKLGWQNLKSADFRNNPPGEMYFARKSADPNKPTLLVKVEVPTSHPAAGAVNMRCHLPNSFLKGLCPEWKQELADYEKSLSTDGVSPDVLSSRREGRYVYIANFSEADKVYLNSMGEKEVECYKRRFGLERDKWSAVTAEEHARLEVEQKEWLKNHPADSETVHDLALCVNFMKRAPKYHIWSSVASSNESSPEAYSLESLESMAAQGPTAVAVKVVASK